MGCGPGTSLKTTALEAYRLLTMQDKCLEDDGYVDSDHNKISFDSGLPMSCFVRIFPCSIRIKTIQ